MTNHTEKPQSTAALDLLRQVMSAPPIQHPDGSVTLDKDQSIHLVDMLRFHDLYEPMETHEIMANAIRPYQKGDYSRADQVEDMDR